MKIKLLSVATVALVVIAITDVVMLVATQPTPKAVSPPVFKERWQDVPHYIVAETHALLVVDKYVDRLPQEPKSRPERASDKIEQTFATILLQQPAVSDYHYRHRRRHH